MVEFRVSEVSEATLSVCENDLAAILHACVANGASVGFVLPFEPQDALRYWREAVFPSVSDGTRHLFVASVGGRAVATIHLVVAQLPNQHHRAEVSKLLVHPDFRRIGIARALMVAIEEKAHEIGRALLTLDTRTGDHAETLYRSMGYETVGSLPGFALSPDHSRYDATTYMYKVLSA